MFEKVIQLFISKYLSNYIEINDTNQLNFGLLKGDLTLNDLKIRSTALDDLDLPVTVSYGYLKKLKLFVSWNNLFSTKGKITIDVEGLTLIITPKAPIYDPIKARKLKLESKLSEVSRLIQLEIETQKSKNEGDETKEDTFLERLEMQLFRNVEINIRNIHIRYEDNYWKPEHPFSFGFTLGSIQLKTTDNETDKESTDILKIASLNSFSIYCNSDDILISNLAPKLISSKLESMIVNQNQDENKINYILDPMTITSEVALSLKPSENNYTKPMLDVSVSIKSLRFNLNKLQYFDLIGIKDEFKFLELNLKYKKYHPNVPIKSNTKTWWFSIIEALLDTKVRKYKFHWKDIKLTVDTRREYKRLNKLLLANGQLTEVELEKKMKCEEILDVFNIILGRKQAELEYKRETKAASSGGWFNWVPNIYPLVVVPVKWLCFLDTSDKLVISDKDKEDMLKEIRSKLDESLDFFDEEKMNSKYPEKYANVQFKFETNELKVSLTDGKYKTKEKDTWISDSKIILLKVENMRFYLEKRPFNSGLKIESSVENLSVLGCIAKAAQQRHLPIIVEAQRRDDLFIKFNYDLNLVEQTKSGQANQSVKLKSKSLKFVFDQTTVNNLGQFFKYSIKIDEEKVKAAAIKTIFKAKQRSILYLQNDLRNMKPFDLNIDIEPSYVLVPKDGILDENTQLICIDLGHLSLKRKMDSSSSQDKLKESADKALSEFMDKSYLKYVIYLKNVQILLASNEKECMEKRKLNQLCENHLLAPLDLSLSFDKCAYSDDANLPSARVFGELPLVEFKLNKVKLEQILMILLSISNRKDDVIVDDAGFKSRQVKYVLSDSESDGEGEKYLEKITKKESDENIELVEKNFQQSTNLELAFEIKEIIIKIKEDNRNRDYFDELTLKLSSMGASVKLKTYDIVGSIYLNSIKIEYNQLMGSLNTIDLVSSLKHNAENRLIEVNFVATSQDSPTFTSNDNTIFNLKFLFRTLDIVVPYSVIDSILNYLCNVNDELTLQIETNNEFREKTGQKPMKKKFKLRKKRQVWEFEQGEIDLLLVNKKKKKAPTITQGRLFQMEFVVNSINASLCDKQNNSLQMSINDLFVIYNKESALHEDIFIKLKSIIVQDNQANSIYKYLITVEDTDKLFIDLHLARYDNHYNQVVYLNNYLNGVDLVVNGEINKLKCYVLYKQISIILNFVSVFDMSTRSSRTIEPADKSSALKTVKSSGKLATSAKASSKKISDFEFITKVKLDLTLNAPLIILPERSNSYDALLLDSGTININTVFEQKKDYFTQTKLKFKRKLVPIIEKNTIELLDLKLLRVALNKDLKLHKDDKTNLLNSKNFSISLFRNLQYETVYDVEQLVVEAIYDGLVISLSKKDYSFIMSAVSSNLSEEVVYADGTHKQDKQQETKTKAIATSNAEASKDSAVINTVEEKAPEFKIKFVLKNMQAKLFSRELDDSLSTTPLSTISIDYLKLKLTNETTATKLFLTIDEILLEDNRATGENALQRLVYRRQVKNIQESMIWCVLNMKKELNGDKTIDTKEMTFNLNGFQVCMSIDYVLFLYDFFVDGLSPSTQKALSNIGESDAFNKDILPVQRAQNYESKSKFLFNINNPQIVLVENHLNVNKTNLLVIEGEIEVRLEMNGKQNLYANLNNFYIRFFGQRGKYEYMILTPSRFDVSATLDETNKQFKINLYETNLSICPEIINVIIKMLNSVGTNMVLKREEKSSGKLKSIDLTVSDIQKFDENDFWFTKSKGSDSMTSSTTSLQGSVTEQNEFTMEVDIKKNSKLFIKLESDIVEQMPLIGFNLELKHCKIMNPHAQLNAAVKVAMEAAYFNKVLSAWEPIVEPYETAKGELKPWEFFVSISQNDKKAKGFAEKHVYLPLYTIYVHSEMTLQLVLTKTFYNLLDKLKNTFNFDKIDLEKLTKKDDNSEFHPISLLKQEEEEKSDFENEEKSTSNILIKNELGLDVYLKAIEGFKFLNNQSDEPSSSLHEKLQSTKVWSIEHYMKITLKDNRYWPLIINESFKSFDGIYDNTKQKIKFFIKTDEQDKPVEVTVDKHGVDGYYLRKVENVNLEGALILCEEAAEFENRRIYLRSTVQVTNMLNIDLELKFGEGKIKVLKPGKKCYVPIDCIRRTMFDLRPIDGSNTFKGETIKWKEGKQKMLSFDKKLNVKVKIDVLDVLLNSTGDIESIYNVIIMPTLILYNYLPYDLEYEILHNDRDDSSGKKRLKPSETAYLLNASFGDYLILEIREYLFQNLYSTITISEDPKPENGIVDFRSPELDVIPVGLFRVIQNDVLTYTIYSPYWVLNRTCLTLDYKLNESDDVSLLNESIEAPLFLRFNTEMLQKKNEKSISFRVKDTNEWSQYFPIDVVETGGSITCKNNKIQYQIGVEVKLSVFGLTKIITLTPYYLFVNKTQHTLEICENHNNDWVKLKPNSVIPYWPKVYKEPKTKYAVLRFTGFEGTSKPFSFDKKHSTSLRFEDTRVVHAECTTSDVTIKTVFTEFEYGKAYLLIVNKINKYPIQIKQSGEREEFTLNPNELMLYTWENPIGTRELHWSCGHRISSHTLNIDTEESSSLTKFAITDHDSVNCLQFLDGNQKVLMFANDIGGLGNEINESDWVQGNRIIVSVHNVGLTVIDNLRRVELLYAWISKPTKNWGELEDSGNFKAFSNEESNEIEKAYIQYETQNSNNGSVECLLSVNKNKSTVNFETMKFKFNGKEGIFLTEPGIHINFYSSKKHTNLQATVFDIQIDNQLNDTVHPVLFSRVKAQSTANKPIIEFTLEQIHHMKTKIDEIKCLKLLVQEFAVKLDELSIDYLTSFLRNEADLNKIQLIDPDKLNNELNEIKKSLDEIAFSDIETLSNLISFHNFYLSHLRIRISYSINRDVSVLKWKSFSENPIFNFLVSTLGEVSDVSLSFGHFEVKNESHSWDTLLSSAMKHYKSQAITQFFKLLMGLNLFGAPINAVRGIQDSVKSIFDPTVSGTDRFFNLPGNVLNIAGQAVGGVFGGVGNVTKVLGKGVANMTFDQDYKKDRQRNSDLGDTLKRGFVDSVTGIINKPKEGLEKEGFGGLMKGLGKGLIGVVTKPTSSIIDVTSQSFEGIKKVVTQEELINKIRPPRYMGSSDHIGIYRKEVAKAAFVLHEIENRKYASDKLVAQLTTKHQNQTNILIASDKHFILLTGDATGSLNSFKIKWCYLYKQLKTSPDVVGDHIEFSTNEGSTFFSSSSDAHRVFYNDKQKATDFLAKVVEQMFASR